MQIFDCLKMKFADIPQRLHPLLHPPDPIVINHLISVDGQGNNNDNNNTVRSTMRPLAIKQNDKSRGLTDIPTEGIFTAVFLAAFLKLPQTEGDDYFAFC